MWSTERQNPNREQPVGRRPKPVEGEVGALTALAAELRRLRHEAGNPPYRTMAVKARYSASTLSEAASGRRLPTLPVVLAYAVACDAETESLREQWRQASAAVHAHHEGPLTGQATPVDKDDPAVPPVVGEYATTRTRARPSRVVGAALAVFAALLLLAALAPQVLPPSHGRTAHAGAPAPGAGPVRTITEDTDPQDTRCDQGRVDTVATANLYGPGRFFLGYVWLRHAPACGAMWARFEPAAGLATLREVRVTIRLVRPSDGRALRYDTPYLGEFVYGNMLRTTHGCLEAEATVVASRPGRGPAAAIPGKGPIIVHGETPCTLSPAPR
jgi:hypothetical protein